MDDTNVAAAVESVILRRRTEKVLADVGHPVQVPSDLDRYYRPLIVSSLETAGWAPFHYPRNLAGPKGGMTLAEPWRAHVLWHAEARKLAHLLQDVLQVTTKAPHLCAACSALVLVTWLPEGTEHAEEWSPQFQKRNEEHLAAAAAMVQNFLLMLTAHGMGTYWSSGGKLRDREVLQGLGVRAEERLLAGIFIEYPELKPQVEQRIEGKQRGNRSPHWFRVV